MDIKRVPHGCVRGVVELIIRFFHLMLVRLICKCTAMKRDAGLFSYKRGAENDEVTRGSLKWKD